MLNILFKYIRVLIAQKIISQNKFHVLEFFCFIWRTISDWIESMLTRKLLAYASRKLFYFELRACVVYMQVKRTVRASSQL